MHISDIDLRLLRVFRAVVEADGFSNAQVLLNVSQSTISNHMLQLEARLGLRLCNRGRSGFALTTEGQAFYVQLESFFEAMHALEHRAMELRGGLVGQLRLGLIDNLITDGACPLQSALKRFYERPLNTVQTSVAVLSPHEMERQVLAGELDAAIGIFCRDIPGLQKRMLYRERDVLVCNRSHPLAAVADPETLARRIPSAAKVVRSFMGDDEFPCPERKDESVRALVTNVEAAATLILSGPFIGYLPQHYAKRWLRTGELVALLPERFFRYSNIALITREASTSFTTSLQVFLECLQPVGQGGRSAVALRPDCTKTPPNLAGQ
jgi:LysR family transcriptional regulator, transcriptional activator for bauABCD operon